MGGNNIKIIKMRDNRVPLRKVSQISAFLNMRKAISPLASLRMSRAAAKPFGAELQNSVETRLHKTSV